SAPQPAVSVKTVSSPASSGRRSRCAGLIDVGIRGPSALDKSAEKMRDHNASTLVKRHRAGGDCVENVRSPTLRSYAHQTARPRSSELERRNNRRVRNLEHFPG